MTNFQAYFYPNANFLKFLEYHGLFQIAHI